MFGFLPGHTSCCTKAAQCYRAHFCGLCNVLRQEYGLWSRWLINRDSTFLSILGNALLHEAPAQTWATCCNPWGHQRSLVQSGPVTPYVAAVTLCGLVAKLEDDQHDEKGLRQKAARLGLGFLSETESRAVGHLFSLGFSVYRVRKTLNPVKHATGIDSLHATGTSYGEIVKFLGTVAKTDSANSSALQVIGHELGFLTHLKDSLDDWELDCKKGKFNPLQNLRNAGERRNYVSSLAHTSLASLKSAFDQLRVYRNRDLLQSVLIDGITSRVNEMQFTRDEYEQRMKNERQHKKNNKDKDGCGDWCDCGGCDCTDCKGCSKCSGKSSGGKNCDGPCDCNPCDGDCCGCDCGS